MLEYCPRNAIDPIHHVIRPHSRANLDVAFHFYQGYSPPIRNTKHPRNVLNTSEVHEQMQTSLTPRDADMFMSPDKGFDELRRVQGAPPMQPDVAHDASRGEPSNTPVSRPRLRLPRPWQLSRNRNGYPPNSFITMADKRHVLSAVYFIYWLALLGYAVTVRVAAAPGTGPGRTLGYIDRAQDIEVYCTVVVALLITAAFGPLAILVVPMSAVAIGLCIMEAIRLSQNPHRRHEYIMLSVLPGLIFLPMLLNIREVWVWYEWYIKGGKELPDVNIVQ
ncbi:hypothetical protein QBC33DRAFT_202069 [Phialemonium atrogriseum]|uniref:Uncharacterized protein n=1 Tax=Phialemonium atrogriseum TaxID=1093897 RepID=A0AAJ0BUH5_9PEZI|nr:uncharacterized protein QBC33DRAFT_202069 [Phialemonium atrogriseum]KAK1764237.1 hypothetical protein QBC33DRAFT_202069 [Phialemonium atrogriseum]